MALAKLSPGIVEISGKMAGNIFKRDASGQHITGTQRRVASNTESQRKQRAWYGGHKEHEREDPGPSPPDEPPKDKVTARVFSLYNITTFRDWSWLEPSSSPEPENPEIRAQCDTIAQEITQEEWLSIGISVPLVSELIYHYWHIAMITWGFESEQAKNYAVPSTVAFCTQAFAIHKTINHAAWIDILKHCRIYDIGSYSANHQGQLIFTRWNLLIQTKNNLFWAGLQARPSQEMYTIARADTRRGPVWRYDDFLNLPIYLSAIENVPDYGRSVLFVPGALFQFYTTSAWLAYTWTFDYMHLVYLGDSHPVGKGEHRMLGDEFSKWYLNVPIGWNQGREAALEYLIHLHELFHPNP